MGFLKEKTLLVGLVIGALLSLFTGAVMLYLTLNPISVIVDWSLTTDKQTYKEGETAYITVTYNKRFDMKGSTVRTLVCREASGKQSEYNPAIIDAHAPPGRGKSVVSASIPPEVISGLPKTCFFKFDSKYIYGFESHTQTNEFIVKEK